MLTSNPIRRMLSKSSDETANFFRSLMTVSSRLVPDVWLSSETFAKVVADLSQPSQVLFRPKASATALLMVRRLKSCPRARSGFAPPHATLVILIGTMRCISGVLFVSLLVTIRAYFDSPSPCINCFVQILHQLPVISHRVSNQRLTRRSRGESKSLARFVSPQLVVISTAGRIRRQSAAAPFGQTRDGLRSSRRNPCLQRNRQSPFRQVKAGRMPWTRSLQVAIPFRDRRRR